MKRPTDNLIKILSLGIGLAIGIVLIAKVCFELSYDSFYKDVDREWIEQFAFRITLSPWYFIGAAAIVLAVVALVIGLSSWRIARMNPVKSLRDN
ncbi:MAG: FtsX-like permease family protein [Bacteroidales bacterium]|nr:FtsX-like permease family protein [Bacteroidales bacterium]